MYCVYVLTTATDFLAIETASTYYIYIHIYDACMHIFADTRTKDLMHAYMPIFTHKQKHAYRYYANTSTYTHWNRMWGKAKHVM
jgi:hypothetical protein